VDFKQIVEEIIGFDKNIRFVAIFDRYGTIIEKVQNDGMSLMIDEYDTQSMLREAASFWTHRKNLEDKLGKGHYSMTVYDKLIRITMPLSSDYYIIISHNDMNDQQ
jgi:predicted DNA-binding protein YlxM (UPF0122 family)